MNNTILAAKNINKYFHSPQKFHVLKDISFDLKKGEFLSLVGKSGCGKSTLLYVLSTMDTDFTGELTIDQQATKHLNSTQLAALRNEKIGFIFQFHYLLPDFTCLMNVMIPALRLGKLTAAEIEHQAYEKLAFMGLSDQALKTANKLSGGQQQRVAIARALINNPLLIMGDEPTGNLDSKNAENVFDLFKKIIAEYNHSIIMVTHDEDFARKSDRIIELKDGAVVA